MVAKRQVRYDWNLRAWREERNGHVSFWTWGPILGWVQHAPDEIEYWRARG